MNTSGKSHSAISRRKFLGASTGSMLASFSGVSFCLGLTDEQKQQSLKVGIISDLHFGNLAPDGNERLEVFIEAAKKEDPDYVIQLGDFCHPEKKAVKLMKTWNAITYPKYHVLGNHDMDKGSKADIQALWDMSKRYYSFEYKGWKFIVMDMNNLKKGEKYVPYANANFYVNSAQRTWADPEQLEWLDKTIAESKKPIIIYTHQPFSDPNRAQDKPVLDILKKHQTGKGRPKVRAVICGHDHADWYRQVDSIHHFCINSASYLWAKGKPWKYEKSLFAFMSIKNGELSIIGGKTKFEAGDEHFKNVPQISNRKLKV